jgi:hypothetical protein
MAVANATIYRVPHDEASTRALGMAMVFVARKDAHDPEFIWWARAAVRDVPSKAHHMIVRRLLEWDRARVRYRYDPLGLEWMQSPKHTLLVDGAGDCNNITGMMGAQSLALGYPARIRFVKSDQTRPGEFSHVYLGIGIPDGKGGEEWIACDATQAHAEPGWQPPHWGKMDFDLTTWEPSTPDEVAFWKMLEKRWSELNGRNVYRHGMVA